MHPIVVPSLSVPILLAGIFASCVVEAQSQLNRISREIEPVAQVELRGSVSPHASARHDAGRMEAGARIAGITLRFALTPTQKAELDALIRAQQTPGSAAYHRWITPEEYARRFGLSQGDIAKLQGWLQRQGFSVERVANSRTSISFSGTAAQVEQAFATQMHRYQINGETHFANAAPIAVPAALAGVVQAVGNLDDFRPRPLVRPRAPASVKVQPNFTSSTSGEHYLTPKDVATIYNINPAYSASYTGIGQSIAVVGQSLIDVADIEAFQAAAGLAKKDPALVLVPGSGTPLTVSGDEAESDLDVEYAGGIATDATIYFVYVGNNTNYSVWDSIGYAVDTRIAPVISVSYGACETEFTASAFASFEQMMQQGASQGQSIIAASGDYGSTSCYYDTNLTTEQRQALAVEYPASSAYVTGMGGSAFTAEDVAASNTTYWLSASGTDVISSARSYIPEVVWNDDSTTAGISSGGGGVSVWAARPGWQAGVAGITAGSYRLVPDISLASSPDNPGYLYCSGDSAYTGITGSCTNGFRDINNQYLTVAGGTSFAAPIFAGMLAILNQKQNSTGQGVVNPTLYALAADAGVYATAFHDVTVGGNWCTAGATYCSAEGASQYAATTAYDAASGLGSVDLYNLLLAWPAGSTSPLEPTVTTLTAATSTPASGASDVITIAVAPQSSTVTATPTGTLVVIVDGTPVASSLALSGGSAAYTFSSTTSGTHVISATYSGDTVFEASSGLTTVTIPSPVTGSGGSGTTTVTVTPSGGYTGTVQIALSTTSTYLQNYACFEIADIAVSSSSAVSATLTIHTGLANCTSASLRGGTVHAFRPARVSGSSPSGNLPLQKAATGLAGAGLALLLGVRFRRMRRITGMLALLVFVTLTGCGGGSSAKTFALAVSPSSVTVTAGTSGIPAGAYSLMVEGSDSLDTTMAASASMSLVVQ